MNYAKFNATKRSLIDQFGLSAKEAAEEAQFVIDNKLIGIAVSPDRTRFYYVQQLGEGSYGSVYTATRQRDLTLVGFAVKQFLIDGDTASFVDEQYGTAAEARRVLNGVEFYNDAVEREYQASRVMLRRLGPAFCKDNVVCIDERFYSLDQQYAYTVSPLRSTLNLAKYLALAVHNRMRVYMARRYEHFPNLDDDPAQLLSLVLSRRTSEQDVTRARNLLALRRNIQIYCNALALQFVKSLALMHSQFIFHVDIKPDNAIVFGGLSASTSDQLQLLLIDFGLSCTARIDSDAQMPRFERNMLRCNNTYDTTLDFLDPLALYIAVEVKNLPPGSPSRVVRERRMREEMKRVEMFAKFDTYAAGKMLMSIFDHTIFNARGARVEFPVVQQTLFMPAGLFELIVDMTGERGYAPGANTNLQQTEEQQAIRFEAFRSRPTMDEVATRLTTIVQNWSDENVGQ